MLTSFDRGLTITLATRVSALFYICVEFSEVHAASVLHYSIPRGQGLVGVS